MNIDALVKNKSAVIGIVILLLAVFAYSIIFKSDGSSTADESQVEGENFVEIANELSGITFRLDLFNTPSYKALVDFSVELLPEPTGRENPFDELGRE